jgi:hypothetical protein
MTYESRSNHILMRCDDDGSDLTETMYKEVL